MARREVPLERRNIQLDRGGIDLQRREVDLTRATRTPTVDPQADAEGGYGGAIVNELIKSYGFKMRDGEMTWSLDKIAQSFQESPVWTTIDYLTLALPVAKWGTAAAKVAGTGTKAARFGFSGGAAGRAYEAGTLSFKEATKVVMRAGSPRTRLGRGLQGYATKSVDEDLTRMWAADGADPAEIRDLYHVLEKELKVEREAVRRLGEESLRSTAKLETGQRQLFTRFLETGVQPGDIAASQADDLFKKAYQQTYEYRNALHEAAFDSGLINEATYAANLEKYMPRLYEQYVATNMARGSRGAGFAAGEAAQRFLPRTADEHPELARIWDPNLSVLKMADAADYVAKQQFAQKLAGSIIAKDSDELLAHVSRWAQAPQEGAAFKQLMGLNDEVTEALGDLYTSGRGHIESERNKVFRAMGWRPLEDLFPTDKVPGYIDRLPDELKGKYIAPEVAEDVRGMMEFMDKGKPSSFINRLYQGSLGYFRASKTAYNPATHVRNYFGGIVFHHLATGGTPKMFPGKGMAAYDGVNADFVEMVRAGVLGSSFDNEVKEAAIAAFKSAGMTKKAEAIAAGRVTAIDFLGDSRVAKFLQGGAGKAERFYRSIDEVWKLDAAIEVRDKFLKAGLNREDAVARAALEVNKYMPQFSFHSPVADVLRKGIPFASFTTEATRVWKNAMQAKPHIAFMWTHVAETASYTIGAMNGYSLEEIDTARSLLPEHAQNKKMMLLPFRVDDQPSFLDLSYLIPMANLSEAEQAENGFFGAYIDPTANPILNIAAAASLQQDPFTKRPIEPRFAEQQLGMQPVEGEVMRPLVGLGEHMLSVMAPPLAPPGFAATNLMQLARGEKSPYTGEPLEPNIGRTVAANLFGMRSYEASVASQMLNVRREEGRINRRMKIWRDNYASARANGDAPQMETALENIRTLQLEKTQDPAGTERYLAQMIKRTEPGAYRGTSTRMLEETLARIGRLGTPMTEADTRAQAELFARYQERRTRGSSGGRRRGRGRGRR